MKALSKSVVFINFDDDTMIELSVNETMKALSKTVVYYL